MKITVEQDKLAELIEAILQAEEITSEINQLNFELFMKLNGAFQQVHQLAYSWEPQDIQVESDQRRQSK